MPISFQFNKDEIARITRSTTVQIDRVVDDASGDFFYKHMNNGSGICPECAPWLGMRTTGDGEDLVPVPPIHPRCKCFLMRADVAIIDEAILSMNLEKDISGWMDHFQWMRKLSPDRLRAVIGRVRTQLVTSGELELEDLYEGAHLRTLRSMGYDNVGNRIAGRMSAVDILSDEDYYMWLEAFHNLNIGRLPAELKGHGPGSADGVAMMLVFAIPHWDRSPKRPKWLAELLKLLREILPTGVALSE